MASVLSIDAAMYLLDHPWAELLFVFLSLGYRRIDS
jgi:hypothetical protein